MFHVVSFVAIQIKQLARNWLRILVFNKLVLSLTIFLPLVLELKFRPFFFVLTEWSEMQSSKGKISFSCQL